MLTHKLFSGAGNGNPPPKDDDTKKPLRQPVPIQTDPAQEGKK